MEALFEAGCKSFGENRLDSLGDKVEIVSEGVDWHFIGTLQRKKIRKILGYSRTLHSVESLVLAEKISQVALDLGIKVEVFLEVNTGEQQKGGFTIEQLNLDFKVLSQLPNIKILGLMTMAPHTTDEELVRSTFKEVRLCQEKLNSEGVLAYAMTELSMGMSNDFELAIEEGSTLVRVGTALFL